MPAKISKNNPATRAKTVESVKLQPRNFYGFNNEVWMSVYAETKEDAERMIRASCKLSKGQPLTIKSM